MLEGGVMDVKSLVLLERMKEYVKVGADVNLTNGHDSKM